MEKFHSRILGILLSLALMFSLTPAAYAAGVRDLRLQTALAAQLKELDLFLGVGVLEDGSTDFDLDRAPSRVEAVTMLVRSLGKGVQAELQPKTHPFTDVPAWADGYVSYAYDQGLTKGTADTAFGTEDTATGAMYVTFMLRALGYADGADFTWDSPWSLAEDCGILPEIVDRNNFLRADAVAVTCAALFAEQKDSNDTLAQKLVDRGAFSQAEFETAFPRNPFLDAVPEEPEAPSDATEEEQASYDAAIDALIKGEMNVTVEARLEAGTCTVLSTRTDGWAHGPVFVLALVYKPGSAQGAGETVLLPLPPRNGLGMRAAPEEPVLSADGRTLTYTCTIPETVIVNPGHPEEAVLSEAGLYQYTVDLSTGESTLEIVALP